MEKPRVLIIDDDPNLRKTLSDILEAKGYEPLAAKDGKEGLALLKRNPVSLVLIDLQLPDVSGLEVLAGIKSEYPSTEAIILTGHAGLYSAIEATNKGAFSYLQKPYDIDQLLLKIKHALDKQEAEEKIIKHTAELERINAELRTLYEVSLVISRTMDLDSLLKEALQIIIEMEAFRAERKGAIFLIEEGVLRPASFVGPSEDFGQCRTVGVGDCLCGLAASKGEMLISKNSVKDTRHTISDYVLPHGHIIVPLKAPNKITGVLCLFTQPDIEIDEQTLRQLSSIGSQLGVAIENSKSYETAKTFSLHDPLTGLANRRSLQIQMEKLFKTVERYNRPLSVIMLDIDHFKKYNDTYGHVEGDKLLAKIAGILSEHVREADYAFRYGGEEFLLLLPEADSAEACILAERLREAVESGSGVTVSLGVASCHDSTKEGIIDRADAAMYQAKQEGRNRVGVAAPRNGCKV